MAVNTEIVNSLAIVQTITMGVSAAFVSYTIPPGSETIKEDRVAML